RSVGPAPRRARSGRSNRSRRWCGGHVGGWRERARVRGTPTPRPMRGFARAERVVSTHTLRSNAGVGGASGGGRFRKGGPAPLPNCLDPQPSEEWVRQGALREQGATEKV